MASAFVSAIYGPFVLCRYQISKALECKPQVDSTIDPSAATYEPHDGPLAPLMDDTALAEKTQRCHQELFLASTLPLNAPHSRTFGVLLYPGFNSLDVTGFLEYPRLRILSILNDLFVVIRSLDAVSADHNWGPNGYYYQLLPTHTFANPPSLDILLIPGLSKFDPFPEKPK